VIAPVPQSCVYVPSADRERVLLIRRDKIAGDLDALCFMVFDDDPRPFFGVMPYDGGTMLDWSYQR
jgi:hypothetical protein